LPGYVAECAEAGLAPLAVARRREEEREGLVRQEEAARAQRVRQEKVARQVDAWRVPAYAGVVVLSLTLILANLYIWIAPPEILGRVALGLATFLVVVAATAVAARPVDLLVEPVPTYFGRGLLMAVLSIVPTMSLFFLQHPWRLFRGTLNDGPPLTRGEGIPLAFAYLGLFLLWPPVVWGLLLRP
jgi:hypothetical protein